MTNKTITIEVPTDASITINGETWTPPKTNGLPMPTEDNKGVIINNLGDVLAGAAFTLEYLLELIPQGNWFPTKAQAELAIRQRATKRLLDEISAKDGFVDWGDEDQPKHYILLDGGRFLNNGWVEQSQNQGTTYFLSQERAQEAIDTIGVDAIRELFLDPNQPQE